jgi:hypothetical protein
MEFAKIKIGYCAVFCLRKLLRGTLCNRDNGGTGLLQVVKQPTVRYLGVVR